MLFNSLEFLFFFSSFFILYWSKIRRYTTFQNFLIVVSSYFFYGWWDWRFLILIFLSTLTDFYVGNVLYKSENIRQKKFWLGVSIVFNLGILGFFKYYNFFVQSWMDMWASLGVNFHLGMLNIILPVGISFYTFQTLSYSIDIYRGNLKPTNNFVAFAAFISFFPQLVAGPIERARNLLPQFLKARSFNYEEARSGIHLILWGLFKKVVVADTCAFYVDKIFHHHTGYEGGTLLLGALFFTFQIYGDFSGYTDIARGLAKLLGFDLMVNFNFPYFSRNIAEFWQRWHISLSTWFRDYLYIPLGGSRGNTVQVIRNIFIVFLVSGFWHGANWTFIAWGGLNACYFIPLMLMGKNRKYKDKGIKGKEALQQSFSIITTFFLTVNAWILFRSVSIAAAYDYYVGMYASIFKFDFVPVKPLAIIFLFLLMEWQSRNAGTIFGVFKENKVLRWGCYLLIAYVVVFHFSFHDAKDFIYFQF